MDKLMEYADRPPCPPHTTATEQMQQSVLPPGRSSVTSGTHAAASARSGTADHAAFAAGDLGEDAALPTTFATSPTSSNNDGLVFLTASCGVGKYTTTAGTGNTACVK